MFGHALVVEIRLYEYQSASRDLPQSPYRVGTWLKVLEMQQITHHSPREVNSILGQGLAAHTVLSLRETSCPNSDQGICSLASMAPSVVYIATV